MSRLIDDEERTYTHPETFVRSEIPDIVVEIVRAGIPFGFFRPEGERNTWCVCCPSAEKDKLIRALKAAE